MRLEGLDMPAQLRGCLLDGFSFEEASIKAQEPSEGSDRRYWLLSATFGFGHF